MLQPSEKRIQHIALLRKDLQQAQQRLREWTESGHKSGKQEDEGWKKQEAIRKDEVNQLIERINREESYRG